MKTSHTLNIPILYPLTDLMQKFEEHWAKGSWHMMSLAITKSESFFSLTLMLTPGCPLSPFHSMCHRGSKVGHEGDMIHTRKEETVPIGYMIENRQKITKQLLKSSQEARLGGRPEILIHESLCQGDHKFKAGIQTGSRPAWATS